MLIQIIVAILMVFLAGAKSLRAEAHLWEGDTQAVVAMRRFVIALLSVLIVVLTAASLGGALAGLVIVLWITAAEGLSFVPFVGVRVERVVVRHRVAVLSATTRLWPVLRFFVPRSVIGPAGLDFAAPQPRPMPIQEAPMPQEPIAQPWITPPPDAKLRDVMVPKSDIIAISPSDILGPLLLDRLHKVGSSCFPVTEGGLEKVEGMLYIHELALLDPESKPVREVMNRNVHFLHDGMSLGYALSAFLQTKYHAFMVVNDHNKIVGMVHLDDVIRELYGDRLSTIQYDFANRTEVAAYSPPEGID